MDLDSKFQTLLVVAAADVVLLTCLSSRRGWITRAKYGRFFLWAASALYLPLISYILTYLTNNLSTLANQTCIHGGDSTTELQKSSQELECLSRWVLVVMLTVIVLQSLKSNADMAALAVAAVASPAAGTDDIDSQRIRPSMDSLVYSFWVAGVVVYTILAYAHNQGHVRAPLLFAILTIVFLFWAPGAGRMVLTFAAFRHANGSFALGRNAQLIQGYMSQLQEVSMEEAAVPRLIVTGEKNEDVEESLQGYCVKPSALESSRLVTLDKVWSSRDHRLSPELKDLCLSFSLFKCLRRRFAGYHLAEAGSTWAFRFVCDGLLGEEDDHERMFRVIAHELSFASDFYYSPLPVASLGAWPAALNFVLSLFICAPLSILSLSLVPRLLSLIVAGHVPMRFHLFLLPAVAASMEIWAMVSNVRSNWTKISMVAHCINHSRWSRMISSCLLKCKSPRHWKDVIRQSLLIKPSPSEGYLFIQIFNPTRNQHVKVTSDVKAAVIRSLRIGEHQLSNGIATIQRRCPHLSWPCHGSATTNIDAIIMWHIARSLFEIKYPSCAAALASANMAVANNLSRYCMYLVAEAPDLLPDNVVSTRVRCRQVKECVETCMRGAASEPDLYSRLVESFGHDNSHEVVKMGSRIGEQLVQEVERQRVENQAENQEESAGGEEEVVWELLAEFWSEIILYLAPSDNVKGHIEALQRGGELITLLWALLLHAGITTRPAHDTRAP